MKTKVLTTLFCSFLLGFFSVTAQIPAYYSSVDFTQEGNALKEDLSDLIINTHTTLIPYTSSSTDTWDIIHSSDADVTISNNVILFYGYDDDLTTSDFSRYLKSSIVSISTQKGDSKTNILSPCNVPVFKIVELFRISIYPSGT